MVSSLFCLVSLGFGNQFVGVSMLQFFCGIFYIGLVYIFCAMEWSYFGHGVLPASAPDLGRGVAPLRRAWRARCSRLCFEIKRRLLLGRKVMTNLDSIFKSRDITLPTKVRLVKAMVFPVAIYGCESWTVKKAER